MASKFSAQDQWILCRLEDSLFGFPSELVREMLAIPPVRSVPQLPSHVRGVINLRGRVIPMIDLRSRLGMPTSEETMQNMLQEIDAFEHVHKEWMEELEESIRENCEFTGAVNPRDCRFGQWLAAFQSDNIVLTSAVGKMIEPHSMIHSVASEVLDKARNGDRDGALRRLEHARRAEFGQVIRMFSELRSSIPEAYRETAVVLEGADSVYAVSVDQVASVEHLKEGTLADLPALATAGVNGQVCGIARRVRDDGLVLLLDTDRILDETYRSEAIRSDVIAA